MFIEVTKLTAATKSWTFPTYDTHNGPFHDGERPRDLQYIFIYFGLLK
jgi:hypothetical protein